LPNRQTSSQDHGGLAASLERPESLHRWAIRPNIPDSLFEQTGGEAIASARQQLA